MYRIKDKLKSIEQECLTAKKVMVSKPTNVGEPRNWLREKEVIELYPIGASTVYDWRKKGIIKKWKKVSPRVTVYSKAELEELFNPDSITKDSVEEVTKVTASPTKRRKRIKPKTTTIKKQKHILTSKSFTPIVKQSKEADDKMITNFESKKHELKKDFQEKQAYLKGLRTNRKKLHPAKEGLIGRSKKMQKNLNAKRKTNV